MANSRMIFDYTLPIDDFEATQYGYCEQRHTYAGAASYQNNVPRSARHDGTIAPRDLLCTPANRRVSSGYGQNTRNRSTRSSMDSSIHTASSQSSPDMQFSRTSFTQPYYQPAVEYHEFNGNMRNPNIEITHKTVKSSPRYQCDLENCIDPDSGKRKSVGRKADLKRHMRSVHGRPTIDCKYPKCWRRGEDGFRREDHYIGHLRGYHLEQVPALSTKRA